MNMSYTGPGDIRRRDKEYFSVKFKCLSNVKRKVVPNVIHKIKLLTLINILYFGLEFRKGKNVTIL